jgi:hypothetical protein
LHWISTATSAGASVLLLLPLLPLLLLLLLTQCASDCAIAEATALCMPLVLSCCHATSCGGAAADLTLQ